MRHTDIMVIVISCHLLADEDQWRLNLPNELHFQKESNVFLKMRGATGDFFIDTITGELMTTNDNDQPISSALMTMTDDDMNDKDIGALPTTNANVVAASKLTFKNNGELAAAIGGGNGNI